MIWFLFWPQLYGCGISKLRALIMNPVTWCPILHIYSPIIRSFSSFFEIDPYFFKIGIPLIFHFPPFHPLFYRSSLVFPYYQACCEILHSDWHILMDFSSFYVFVLQFFVFVTSFFTFILLSIPSEILKLFFINAVPSKMLEALKHTGRLIFNKLLWTP